MYIFDHLKKDFFTKFFIINKKSRLGVLKGFKCLIIKKIMRYSSEQGDLAMYNFDLIESLVGLRPNILKIIFKTIKKKKKNIVVTLRVTLNSPERITGLFDTLSIFLVKISRYIRIKKKKKFVRIKIKKKSNYLVLKTRNFSHLLWGSRKMFNYSLKNLPHFDLFIILTFSFIEKNKIFLYQLSFLKLLKS